MKNSIKFLGMFLFLTIGCKKAQTVNPATSILSSPLWITVKNANNQDMLDPLTPGSIAEADVSVAYLVNGVKQSSTPTSGAILDHPYGVIIEKGKDSYVMMVPLGITTNAEGISTTYITIKGTDNETVTAHWSQQIDGNRTISYIDKIFYKNITFDLKTDTPVINLIL